MQHPDKPRWQRSEMWLLLTPVLCLMSLFGALRGRAWWQQHRARQAAKIQQEAEQHQKRLMAQLRIKSALLLRKALWSPDGQTVVSLGRDSLALWDVSTRRMRQPLLRGRWQDIAFSPNGKLLAAVKGEADFSRRTYQSTWTIQTWRVSEQRITPAYRFIRQEDSDPLCLAFTANSAQILLGGGGHVIGRNLRSRGITMLSPTTGKVLQRLVPPYFSDGGFGGVSAIAVENRMVALGQQNGRLSLFHLPKNQPISTSTNYAGAIGSLKFSASGKTLAIGRYDQSRLWDVATFKPINEKTFLWYAGSALDVSPDGRWGVITNGGDPASAAMYKFITLLPLDGTGSARFLRDGTSEQRGRGDANNARFSPDGTRIASAHDNGVVKIWNVKTGTVLMTLRHPL